MVSHPDAAGTRHASPLAEWFGKLVGDNREPKKGTGPPLSRGRPAATLPFLGRLLLPVPPVQKGTNGESPASLLRMPRLRRMPPSRAGRALPLERLKSCLLFFLDVEEFI